MTTEIIGQLPEFFDDASNERLWVMVEKGTALLKVGQYVQIQERGGFERDAEYQNCPSHEFRVPGTRITLLSKGGPSSYAVTRVEEPSDLAREEAPDAAP